MLSKTCRAISDAVQWPPEPDREPTLRAVSPSMRTRSARRSSHGANRRDSTGAVRDPRASRSGAVRSTARDATLNRDVRVKVRPETVPGH